MIAIEHNLDSVFHMKERVFILEIFIPVHVSSTSTSTPHFKLVQSRFYPRVNTTPLMNSMD